MLSKPKYYLLVATSSVMIAYIAITNKLQLVADSYVMRGDLPACEVSRKVNVPTTNSRGLNPDSISFLNWNIYKGQGDKWEADLAKFSQSHELMTIQEALLNQELSGLLQSHDFNWSMNTAFYLNDVAAGVMNVAASEATYSCGFKVNEPLIRVPKSVLVSYYRIEGSAQTLLVANIHGINFSLGLQSYRKQLTQLYNAIEHHNGPMIVAGDFNSWSSNRLAEVQRLVAKLSLSEIEYEVNNKTHVFGNAIDHVFYRQLEAVSNEVLQVTSSDHNPISVNFRFIDAV